MTAVIVLALAAVISGYSHYEYQTSDCKVEIHSLRVFSDGRLDIDKDCQLKANADKVTRTE